MLRKVFDPAATLLANFAQPILKPCEPVECSMKTYIENNFGRVLPLQVNIHLKAYSLNIQQSHPTLSEQIAIVYMAGNCGKINDNLSTLEPFLFTLLQYMQTTSLLKYRVTLFFQDYFGRDTNCNEKGDNFSLHDYKKDVTDQAALIQKLIEKGYKKNNIIIIGYSYGSAVALGVLDYLIKVVDISYKDIKFLSDRGYGNLFNHPYIKPLIFNQDYAHQQLAEKNMMPDSPLATILAELPESLILHIMNDRNIPEEISLATAALNDQVIPNYRIICTEATQLKNRPHFERRVNIVLKCLPEIKFFHIVTALIAERPIQVYFRFPAITSFSYKLDDEEEMTINFDPNKTILNSDINAIQSDSIIQLIQMLDNYCIARAERAKNSGQGKNYNHSWFKQLGDGWTAGEQVKMALLIMEKLQDFKNNIVILVELKDKDGPHKSGGLGMIYSKLMDLILEYKKIDSLNKWLISMPDRRAERQILQQVSEIKLNTEWNFL